MSIKALLERDAVKYTIFVAGGLAALWYLVSQLKSAFNDPTGGASKGSVGSTVSNNVTTFLGGLGGASPNGSGANAIDNSPYIDAGIVGATAATANSVSGGTLGAFGEWVGGKLADIFQPYDPNAGSIPTASASKEVSGAIQTSSNRPYQNGNNAAYADAWNSSPTDPVYTASPLTTTGSWDD